jgi:phosphate starvation-inducible PhoH-like protein
VSSIPSVSICKFTGNDVMRHPLVQDIVRAYDQDSRERAERREGRRDDRREDRRDETQAGPPDAGAAAARVDGDK